ncbi:MAG: signal peptidase II [Clostridia bacterium]|nr:signal peptidase II [Clostridia bacterium]
MLIIYFLVIAALVAVDQIIKYFVVSNLAPVHSVNLIQNFLSFTYTENTGAAFGMFSNNSIVFAVITVIISAGIIMFLLKYKKQNWLSVSSSLMIIAGGIGNLIDRVRLQYVIDYIYFHFFGYIFNFADCLITVGVAMFAVFVIFFMDKEKSE